MAKVVEGEQSKYAMQLRSGGVLVLLLLSHIKRPLAAVGLWAGKHLESERRVEQLACPALAKGAGVVRLHVTTPPNVVPDRKRSSVAAPQQRVIRSVNEGRRIITRA